ncbi:MAG: UDP-N-acetylmuramate--L-alanine ligase [Deltaproteobacteria bacterium]|nr:UDP-N-acetylmuramate--L-alanine ligase [Deltaproteobacteria bacterium]
MFRGRVHRIHFVGIGGIGMSGIAEVLLNLGYSVSGSDLKQSDVTRRLEAAGARIHEGHRPENVAGADVVVYSSAVVATNVEVEGAREAQIPVIRRAEMLAELMRLKYGVAVAGAHGKTTTTSLIATVLSGAGLDPTVVIGGKLNAIGSNARLGQGEILVAEADESDGSFLHLTPTVAVVTNIDPEHLDHWSNLEAIQDAFVSFLEKVPFYGLAVLCLDHPNVQAILPRLDRRLCTYGFSAQADYRARAARFSGLESTFEIVRRGKSIGDFTVRMPGPHNVLNCLATVAVADELGVPPERARDSLATFGGVQRRFTVVDEVGGVMVVDDYGHHPAEVRATLEAAQRAYSRRVVVLFQPHRHTRTRDQMHEFATAFNRADVVFVMDIYAAGETPIAGVDSARLVKAIRKHGHKAVEYLPDRNTAVDRVVDVVQEGDIVITLGAGDVSQLAPRIAERLRRKGEP